MEKYFNLTTEELEILTIDKIRELKIKNEDYFKIANSLHVLKSHDLGTYNHCLRVGLLAAEIGEKIHLRPKPLFLAGILHDYGKICVDDCILNDDDFDEADYEKTKIHPIAGYRLLQNDFPFSANVLLRHHSFGNDPYPKNLPRTNFSEEAIGEINYFSRFLALIDYYDAIQTRDSDKYEKELDVIEKQEALLRDNLDVESLVKELYKQGLFV